MDTFAGNSAHPTHSVVSLDFTHVYYDENDIVSLVFAWISLAPQALLIIYATLITSRREAETILLLGGQIGCELVNNYLKRVIKEERPRCKYIMHA
jgi:dolichyldiphosphatase